MYSHGSKHQTKLNLIIEYQAVMDVLDLLSYFPTITILALYGVEIL
jgi:hypothetical protein